MRVEIALIGLSYFLGAIPLGLLFAWCKGVDIRKVGSGNIGATNVFRCVSKPLGIATFVGDAVKGFVPAFFFPMIGKYFLQAEPGSWLGILCGCAAIAGHNWPVYLGFKGGKGVSTSAGMLIGIAPAAAGIGFLAWGLLVGVTRYVSAASIGAAAVVPAAGWWLYAKDGLLLPIVLTVLGGLVIWKHRANIRRLMRGEEHRFGRKI
ncbi:MAG: acyl-phosphate glycerol 3-phosphate acyltransferase [Lentisphaerae bacterium GWF2_57_35]|nr:MAG: acyl-phosphate glycerol 3-phosphate acyltransferase [Lentisphaerae bacterium GWF2_57_35]